MIYVHKGVSVMNSALKYGENPYMNAHIEEVRFDMEDDPLSVLTFMQPDRSTTDFTKMSSTNVIDLSRALETLKRIAAVHFRNGEDVPAAAVAVKHGNPCGAAISHDITRAVHDAFYGDPDAVFGGLIIVNRSVTEEVVKVLEDAFKDHHNKKVILAGVVAPDISCDLSRFERKRGACHLLVQERLANVTEEDFLSTPRIRYVSGARISEEGEMYIPTFDNKNCVAGSLTRRDVQDLMLAWAVGSSSNSNSITLVKNGMVIGNGVGQQSRIRAVKVALMCAEGAAHARKKADETYIEGAVAYSDSFFPISDAVEALVNAGVRAIFATSGSENDKQTTHICRQYDVALYMEPDKIARGFFGHC